MTGGLAGRRVLVLGLGHFGGQIAAVRWLVREGADVVVTDLQDANRLEASLKRIAGLPRVRVHTGDDGSGHVAGAELIVASPAVPLDAAALREAGRRGIPVTSEIELFLERSPARLVGVTGSNGKTTTTHLLAHLLATSDRRAHVLGNAGGGSLGRLAEMKAEDVGVVELSSFMLERLPPGRQLFCAAVLTGISPNHLDRHGDLEAYVSAKAVLVDLLAPDAPFVLPADQPLAAPIRERARESRETAEVSLEGEVPLGAWVSGDLVLARRADTSPVPLFSLPDLRRRGRAWLLDAMLAAWTAFRLGVPPERIAERLHTGPVLPHRLQDLGTARGVSFVNDSASTTPESTLAALDALAGRRVHVLVGGASKGPLDPGFPALLARAATSVHLFGRIAGDICPHGSTEGASWTRWETLEEALEAALARARRGDVVLFSPGHASFDQFPHFEARGEAFAALVREIASEKRRFESPL